MALAFLRTEKNFRRIVGYRDLQTLVLQCYKLASLAESARCAEPGELTEMERHMQQTAKTLTEIIMSQSDFSFVTL
jgi:hypothetical protein